MPTIPRAYNSAVSGGVPEDEIEAIIARLREEVRLQPPSAGVDGARLPIRLTARQDAERLWPVSADRPLQRRLGRSEALLTPVRTVVRKLVRWYVEPPFADQREFNSTVLALIDDLAELAAAKLRPGGVLVLEAGGSVPPESAASVARAAGFRRADVRFGAGAHGYALVARL